MVGFGSNLEKLIASEVAALAGSFELIGLEFDNHNNPKVLRVYADVVNKPPAVDSTVSCRSSITLDECVKISYHLNKVLSVAPNLQLSNYVLEVSSPGVERRLFNLVQFEQHIGKVAKLHLIQPLNGRSNFVGILCSVDHSLNRVLVDVDGQNIYFDFDNIAKANLVYRK